MSSGRWTRRRHTWLTINDLMSTERSIKRRGPFGATLSIIFVGWATSTMGRAGLSVAMFMDIVVVRSHELLRWRRMSAVSNICQCRESFNTQTTGCEHAGSSWLCVRDWPSADMTMCSLASLFLPSSPVLLQVAQPQGVSELPLSVQNFRYAHIGPIGQI